MSHTSHNGGRKDKINSQIVQSGTGADPKIKEPTFVNLQM